MRDDDDSRPRQWPANLLHKPLLIALALATCLAFLAGSLAYAVVHDRRAARHAAKVAAWKVERASPSTAGKYGRPQLAAMLAGKSAREVVELIGERDSVEPRSFPDFNVTLSETWNYRRLSYDPVTLKPDDRVLVYFAFHRVVRVEFD